MDEYIKKLDAFQAKNEFLNPCVVKNTNEETEYAKAYAKGWNDCNSSFIDNIDKIPTADVQEVRHGKWEHKTKPVGYLSDEFIECSCCNAEYDVAFVIAVQDERKEFDFCPNCGAKMDGKDNPELLKGESEEAEKELEDRKNEKA